MPIDQITQPLLSVAERYAEFQKQFNIVPDPDTVELWRDEFTNEAVGLLRVRRADLMKSSNRVRLWEWSVLENEDGTWQRNDSADYFTIAELTHIVAAAEATEDAPFAPVPARLHVVTAHGLGLGDVA